MRKYSKHGELNFHPIFQQKAMNYTIAMCMGSTLTTHILVLYVCVSSNNCR